MKCLPNIRYCCCIAPVRTGSLIIAYIYLTLDIIIIGFNYFIIYEYDVIIEKCEKRFVLFCHLIGGEWEHRISAILAILGFVSCVMILFICYKDWKARWLVIPICVFLLFPIWVTVQLILYLIGTKFLLITYIMTYITLIGVNTYVVLILNSFYQEKVFSQSS